jgi:small subunit ribosomal protein S7
MSRKKVIKKSLCEKDFKYNSILVTLLINRILKNGKKKLATKIVYKTFKYIFKKTKENPLVILETAVRKASPCVILKTLYKKNIASKTPVLLNIFNATIIAICWLIKFATKKSKKQLYFKLGTEILDASKGVGLSIKKKEEIHKIAKANKTFLFIN